MSLFYGTKPPEEIKPKPPELDAEELEKIQDESEHLADIIRNAVIDIKRKKQTQRIDGAEVYHNLNAIIRAINTANDAIDRAIENQEKKGGRV